jgi:hypothetical protein
LVRAGSVRAPLALHPALHRYPHLPEMSHG